MTENHISEDRAERLSFHLSTGDYFPMLATILGFVQESVQDSVSKSDSEKELVSLEADVLKDTRDDLMYLYKNYKIVPITEGK